RYNSATPITGLTNGGYYYVTMSADGQSLSLSQTKGGPALDLTPTGALTNTHTLTGAETFTVDAADDVFLDVRALLRRDVPAGELTTNGGTYLVHIDRISAVHDADLLRRP